MKYNDNGEYNNIYVKSFDTLPVGAIVEYSGATIPSGWTDIGNNKIQKTSQYIEGGAGLPSYFTDEIKTGEFWIDGKPLYRKVYFFDNIPSNATTEIADVSGLNLDNMIHMYGCAQTPLNYSSLSKRPLPLAGGGADDIRIDIDNGKLRVKTYSNWSAFIRNYIVLEYTKTTD